jgi:hypothetical protein
MNKATDQISTSPPKDPAPADDCPVLHLALEYDRLAARMRSEEDDPDGDAIFSRMHAISEEASYLTSTSRRVRSNRSYIAGVR